MTAGPNKQKILQITDLQDFLFIRAVKKYICHKLRSIRLFFLQTVYISSASLQLKWQPFYVSLLILPLTFLCFTMLPKLMSLWEAYLVSFVVYWSFCLLHAWHLKKGSVGYMYGLPKWSKIDFLLIICCFVPAVGALSVSFLPAVSKLTDGVALLIMGFSVLNGFVEKFYWRTAYISRYGQEFYAAFLLPALLFGCWHVSVWAAPGVTYQRKFAALVGGASFMSLLRGYTAYR